MANALRIAPTDTLMFRDGRPFNQDDEGAAAAESLFPPPPPTLAGAVRLAIARQHGFPPEPWPEDLVGNGVNWQCQTTPLGKLRFGALRMELDGTPLLPAPAHLGRGKIAGAGGRAVDSYHLLGLPERALFSSDMSDPSRGDVIFPMAPPDTKGFKALQDHWLTFDGMLSVLDGSCPVPQDILSPAELYQSESHVGIGIGATTRLVNEGQLYTARFIRLRDGVRLCLEVEGLPEGLEVFNQRLGGEHRQAHFTPANTVETLPQVDPDGLNYTLIAIAPVFLDHEPLPGMTFEGLPGHLVSACIPKPFMLGGWGSREHGPLPLRPIMPAGTVFFLQCATGETPPVGRVCVGLSNIWGFGHCLTGRWPRI